MYRTPARFSRTLEIPEITPEAVMERLSYRLRRMIGSGRRWNYYGVATRTQIDVRTLKAYVQGTACPNLVKYKRMLAILGPEIGTELNIMKGWLPRSDTVPPEALDLSELREELARAAEILADVLAPDSAGPQSAPDLRDLSDDREPEAEFGDADDDLADTHPEFRAPLRIEHIDVEAVAARLGYRLQRMIGPGRRWQLAEVADQTGIDRRTMQSYLDGTACPNLARYHRLGHLLGPEIGVELAYMIGWEPRYGHSLPLPRANVESLMESLKAGTAAIDDFVGAKATGGGSLRLIRRNDRVSDTAAPESFREETSCASAELEILTVS